MLIAGLWSFLNKDFLKIFKVWQVPLFILLAALIIFYIRMRKRQV